MVAAVENWQPAADVYRANFDHHVAMQDLSDVEASIALVSGFSPDMVIGGPPCQDFSHAGNKVEAGRAALTEAYSQIVATVKPRCFVMENVPRAQKSNAFASARSVFKAAGYGLTERVLIASLCGCPQKRKRFFCIGMMGEQDGFLDAALEVGLAETPMTVRDYLGDSMGTEFYYVHPRNYQRRGIFSIDEPAPTMRGQNRPMSQGYPGHHNDACKPGPNVRPLTSRERALIQTFPPDFEFFGSKSAQEQMIGNAVPVNLGRYVAEALVTYMDGKA